jgi:hypothetical protein
VLFPLTAGDLTAVLPAGQVLRADRAAAARVLGHAATAAFLAEVGLPWCSGAFQLSSVLAGPAVRAMGGRVIEPGGAPRVFDTAFGEFGALGSLGHALVHVRRADGVVFASSEDADEEYEVVNSDVSSLAKLLLLVEDRAPDPDLPYLEALPRYAGAAAQIEAEVSAVDPAAFADDGGFWRGYLDTWAGGMYPRLPR